MKNVHPALQEAIRGALALLPKREVSMDDESGKFSIVCGSGLEYEADFDTREEAQAIADAHDDGATTYEEAKRIVLELV